MTESQQIRIGIMGTANIAVRSVIPAIADLTGKFKLSAIASRSLSAAEQVAASYQVTALQGYEALVDRELCDAVYVPLPNSLHFAWVRKCLENGIHVLVEKSMGCNLAEVEELNQLAQRQGLVLAENFQFRFHRQLSFIQELLATGRIGQLRCLRSSFGFPPFKDAGNIRYQPALGGGALLDAGAYPVKIAQIFLGQQLKVKAANLNYGPEHEVDIWGGAYLQQKKGNLFAEIAFGFDHYYQCNLELWGSTGKIYTNRIFTAPPGYQPQIILETASGTETISLEPDHHFINMLQHFYQLITNGNERDHEYQQNINQARLIGELKEKANV